MICLYKTAGSVLVVRGIGAVANGNTARATLRNVTPCQAFHATCRRGPYGGNIGGIRSLKNAIRTTLLRPSVMWLTSDKPLRRKGLQRIAKYGNMISRGVGNIWQSFQIGGYECIKREYVTPIKRGAIAVFVDVGSSSSRWFRRREGAFPRILFSDQRNESRRTPEQKLIHQIAERQRHGCRGCADHGFAAAFRIG